jgi:polyhydroxyalkanoate synthesis regulator phasin
VFDEVEKTSAPDGAEEQEQVNPERQAIVDRLNASLDEIATAKEHVDNLRREVVKIENELDAYDKAARVARFKAAVQGAA